MPNPSPARDSASLDQFSALAQRQAVAARNLVNTDELKTWLDELLASRFGSPAENANHPHPSPRQTACERWIRSVARKWMIRQGQTEQRLPEGDALAQSPAWIQQAISNGTPPQRLSLLPSEHESLAGVLDWLRSDQGPSLGSDWSRISVEQAIRSETAWIDAMAKAALKKDLEAADAAGTTLFVNSPAPGPDGRSGWRWVQVHSKEALDREGSLMRHCVGSYANDVAADRKSIYSLRDPDNKPRLTLETQLGRIAQLKAFSNQPCPPELFPRVAEFATAFNALCQAEDWRLQVSREAEDAGVLIVPGLGLAVLGSTPPSEFSIRFAKELNEKNIDSIHALPILAALGWNDLLQAALPHASIALKNKALVRAAELGQLSSVELLIPHSDPKADNSLALRSAARWGRDSVVELLIAHSDPKARESRALCLAASKGHLEVAKLLLPHSDPQADDSLALRSAAENGHLSVVQLLLPHSDPNTDYSYALRWASANGHLAIARLLLPRSNPKATPYALSMAAENGHLPVVRLLIPHCDAKANDSHALTMAANQGHLAIVELLLPHSDPQANHSQALVYAGHNGHLAVVEAIQAAIDAQAHLKAPELASVGHKLPYERQRQSQPALTPTIRP